MQNQAPFYKRFKPRDCAICGKHEKIFLYRQQFSRMTDSSLIEGYDVVACRSCGFTFADMLPGQDEFDRYYREMSKYEYHHSGGMESEYDTTRFHGILDLIVSALNDTNARIIDIGCATGKLLSLLVERGYRQVVGLDPSPGCAQAAEKLYGITVATGPVTKISTFGELFDCIILSGILEHIRDLRGVLALLREHLSNSGIICIQTPDASRFSCWPDAPFQQFSVEHINYFTAESLRNLLKGEGFIEVQSTEEAYPQSATTMMPVVTSVFRKQMQPPPTLVRDAVAEIALREYITQSMRVENSINQTIDRLVRERIPLVVWGAGTHTLHLLETTTLSQANIRAFVDSNVAYHGKMLHGVPICAPDALKKMTELILVSSRVFQKEIVTMIRDILAISNTIVTLYDFDSSMAPGKHVIF